MKNYIKMFVAGVFLATALPFTMTLLINGRQGIHQEKQLDSVDYQVLQQMLAEDLSWMSDDTLKLLAVLYRTEELRVGETTASTIAEDDSTASTGAAAASDPVSTDPSSGSANTAGTARENIPLAELYGEQYERVYAAVESTAGMAVTIDGEYRELPFHKLSAGQTRAGQLLGAGYDYVISVECREDKEAPDYVQICTLSMEEMLQALGVDGAGGQTALQKIAVDDFVFQRDSKGYVESVSLGNQTWTGEAFRTLLHFPSSCFWIKADDSRLAVTVKGIGHGFGISLYTADRRIREGMPWQDIFSCFYKNAQCITIP